MAALVPDLKKFIIGREIKENSSVSSSTWRKIAGMINFLGHRSHQQKSFYVNGAYGDMSTEVPLLGVDGKGFFEFDAEIFNVWVFNDVPGSSGLTELDIKVKPKSSGTYTSIFSTTPKIHPEMDPERHFEIGDDGSLLGFVAPVLNGGVPYNVNKGDAVRLDIIQAMPDAENCGVVIHYRPR